MSIQRSADKAVPSSQQNDRMRNNCRERFWDRLKLTGMSNNANNAIACVKSSSTELKGSKLVCEAVRKKLNALANLASFLSLVKLFEIL